MIYEVIEMYKFMCSCGCAVIFYKYTIHLEGTMTFRRYVGECFQCLQDIDTMDIHEDDLLDQEFLC
jgi:hypothetical protein